MNVAMDSATQALETPVTTITTPDGIVIHPDRLYRGLAKLSITGEHLPADATNHAIVFDVGTGLMESVNAPGFDNKLAHDDATELAAKLSFAGYSDWSLPNVPEAVNSVDYTREEPAADINVYPDAKSDWYWTKQQTAWSLEETGSSRSFFFVGMSYGLVDCCYASGRLRARPVRRAAPASQCLVIGQ
jgi:hypothetical protein